jgi:hypothetical protein
MRVGLLLLAMTVLLSISGCVGESGYTKAARRFDVQGWKSAVGDDRCAMVDDLRERIGLKGRSRAEVIALLGKPEAHSGDPSDHYHLCPSFMDVWILEIHWKDGRVASTRVRDT